MIANYQQGKQIFYFIFFKCLISFIRIPRYTKVTPHNKHEYVRLALKYRLHEFDEQVKAVRDGMSKVIPVPLLSLFSASQLQVGNFDIFSLYFPRTFLTFSLFSREGNGMWFTRNSTWITKVSGIIQRS